MQAERKKHWEELQRAALAAASQDLAVFDKDPKKGELVQACLIERPVLV